MNYLEPFITQIIRFAERLDDENVVMVVGCIGVYQTWVLVCNYAKRQRC